MPLLVISGSPAPGGCPARVLRASPNLPGRPVGSTEARSLSRSREFRDSDRPQVRSGPGAALVCIARLLGASAAAGSSRRVASAGLPAAGDLARGCAPRSERAPPAGSCSRASHAASGQQPWHLPGRPHWGSASPPPRPARPCPPQPSLISPYLFIYFTLLLSHFSSLFSSFPSLPLPLSASLSLTPPSSFPDSLPSLPFLFLPSSHLYLQFQYQ